MAINKIAFFYEIIESALKQIDSNITVTANYNENLTPFIAVAIFSSNYTYDKGAGGRLFNRKATSTCVIKYVVTLDQDTDLSFAKRAELGEMQDRIQLALNKVQSGHYEHYTNAVKDYIIDITNIQVDDDSMIGVGDNDRLLEVYMSGVINYNQVFF